MELTASKLHKSYAIRTPSIGGDLEIFGLPGLLQMLSSSKVTGRLTLQDLAGNVVGTIDLAHGNLRQCHAGQLRGQTAFYQLLERQRSDLFEFSKSSEPLPEFSLLMPVLPLLMEGMRRHDELRKLQLEVPDSMKFIVKSSKPTCPPEEEDGFLFQELWFMLQRETTPLQAEAAVPVDAYRIRRLLAYWIKTGAIARRS